MEKRTLFEAGDTVASFTGQAGMVVSKEAFAHIRKGLKEAKRPGHYFAPGCCHNPDYRTQVPVLFEDGTYDVMRAMNIRKTSDLPEETRSYLLKLLNKRRD